MARLVGEFRRHHPSVRVDLAAPEDSRDLFDLVETGLRARPHRRSRCPRCLLPLPCRRPPGRAGRAGTRPCALTGRDTAPARRRKRVASASAGPVDGLYCQLGLHSDTFFLCLLIRSIPMTMSKRAVGHGASVRSGSDRRCGVPGLGTNFDSTPPWPWRDSASEGFLTDACSGSVRDSADRRSRPSDESSASPARAPARSSLTYANVGTSRWPTRRRAAGRNLSRSLPAGSNTSRPSEKRLAISTPSCGPSSDMPNSPACSFSSARWSGASRCGCALTSNARLGHTWTARNLHRVDHPLASTLGALRARASQHRSDDRSEARTARVADRRALAPCRCRCGSHLVGPAAPARSAKHTGSWITGAEGGAVPWRRRKAGRPNPRHPRRAMGRPRRPAPEHNRGQRPDETLRGQACG